MSTNTPIVPTWKVEFGERLAQFAKAVGLPAEVVTERFKKLGLDGTSEEQLDWLGNDDILKFGDLRASFEDVGIARLRAGMMSLRPKGADQQAEVHEDSLPATLAELIKSQRPKSDWTTEELLSKYDRDTPEIAEVLRKRYHGHRCIVLNPDETVNKEVTLRVMRAARKQPIPEIYIDGGVAYRCVRPGDWPVEYVDASPFFPTVPLVNGYCPESDTNWADVDRECLLLAHIYATRIDTKLTKHAMKAVCQDAKKGATAFRKEYPRAGAIYDELQNRDELPKLRINPRVTPKDTGF